MKKILSIIINFIYKIMQADEELSEDKNVTVVDLPVYTLPSKKCIKKYNNLYAGKRFFCKSKNEFYVHTEGDEYIKIHTTLK